MALPSYESKQDWAALCRHSHFWKEADKTRWVLWLDAKKEVVQIYGASKEFKSQLPMPLEQIEKRIPSEVSWVALEYDSFARSQEAAVKPGPQISWMESLGALKLKTTPVKGELSSGSIQAFEKHFLVRAMRSWQGWFLPHKFAVVMDLKSVTSKAGQALAGLRDEHSLVMIFQDQKLEAYFAENSLGLVIDSTGDAEVRARAIRERLGIPVQYVSMHELDWVDLIAQKLPWEQTVKAISEHRLSFYPSSTRLMAWIYLMRAWERLKGSTQARTT